MVDSKNNPNNFNTLKISIEKIVKNYEMLRFVPDHLMTKKLYKNSVKKLPFVIKYVHDRHKTKEMCDKNMIEIGGMLGFAHDCCKDQKMCGKAVDNYSHAVRLLQNLKESPIKLSKLILPQCNMFMNAISLKKCVIKLLILLFLYLILFLIDM